MLILYRFFVVILLSNQAAGDFVLISSGLFTLIPSLPGISLLLILSPGPIWGRVCLHGSNLNRAGGNLLQAHRAHHRDREWGRPDRLPWQTVAGTGPLWLAAGPAAGMRGRREGCCTFLDLWEQADLSHLSVHTLQWSDGCLSVYPGMLIPSLRTCAWYVQYGYPSLWRMSILHTPSPLCPSHSSHSLWCSLWSNSNCRLVPLPSP